MEKTKLIRRHSSREFESINKMKQKFLDRDLQFKRTMIESGKGFTDPELTKHLREWSEPTGAHWTYDKFLEIIGDQFKNTISSQEIATNRSTFYGVRAWVALVDLTTTGAMYEAHTGPQEAQRLKPGRGNYYDCNIAIGAVFSDYFVVNDKNLRWKCEFLREKGVLKFRSVELKNAYELGCFDEEGGRKSDT